ncbi:hypothetical protein AGMMS49574_08440 [Bacteroidia bacterium]|nr:hypothetical protein AGMMS49574_08440 [Bacteroidia bacterium]
MKTKFKSKVDWWYYVLLFIALVVAALTLSHNNIWGGGAAILAFLVLLYVLCTTYYVITADGILRVCCGFFPRKETPISGIGAIERSLIPLFSYSLSLTRIIIWKDKKMWMLVSPQNESDFVRLLKKYNPEIVIITDEDDTL